MFQIVPCETEGCIQPRIHLSSRCFTHLQDSSQYLQSLRTYFETNPSSAGLVFSGINFTEFNFNGLIFYLCSFTGCSFTNCSFDTASFRLCFLDQTRLAHCEGNGLNVYDTVFAASLMEECSFTESNIILANCNWVRCINTTFQQSDLYNSRFIGASLENVSFKDCNLLNTDFSSCNQSNVSFKYSNVSDAIFNGEDRV